MSTWTSDGPLRRLLGRRHPVRDWRRLAREAARPGPQTDALRGEARALRRDLDHYLLASDPAVVRDAGGLADLTLPAGTDWRWRPPVLSAALAHHTLITPENGRGLGEAAQIFHDCPLRALILRQIRNRRNEDPAPFGLKVECFGFLGSYAALAIPLPPEAVAGLTRGHILRMALQFDVDRPVGVAARLHIRNGPNTDRLHVPLEGVVAGRPNRHLVEFDMADTEIDEARLEGGWIDLMIIEPAMTGLALRDMVVSRHPRAEI
ncbi:hypothetical protein GI374_09245 [Paracoccus sp. S-4012]|uniref:DUF6478 family protein n=1 Tax=Paracoccus sp. S-4012 TaxID=2665648 RepID=UPI0012B11D88|nr:DUF6478 family protein [Paracoccus sp. S-4012]MRX50628.1 hypothetical protein [Paracoccus sp. S-4012]